MTRSLSTAARVGTQSQQDGEVYLWFATISADDLPTDIRVVSEGPGSISYKNGAIVNYQFQSLVYLGCPFKIEWISDDEQPSHGQVTVPDPDHRIGIEVLTLTASPRIRFDLVKLSDYGTSFGSSNERLPLGSPLIEVEADFFYLRNVSGDSMQVQADLTTYDVTTEPWPKTRATVSRLPWLAK